MIQCIFDLALTWVPIITYGLEQPIVVYSRITLLIMTLHIGLATHKSTMCHDLISSVCYLHFLNSKKVGAYRVIVFNLPPAHVLSVG